MQKATHLLICVILRQQFVCRNVETGVLNKEVTLQMCVIDSVLNLKSFFLVPLTTRNGIRKFF